MFVSQNILLLISPQPSKNAKNYRVTVYKLYNSRLWAGISSDFAAQSYSDFVFQTLVFLAGWVKPAERGSGCLGGTIAYFTILPDPVLNMGLKGGSGC